MNVKHRIVTLFQRQKFESQNLRKSISLMLGLIFSFCMVTGFVQSVNSVMQDTNLHSCCPTVSQNEGAAAGHHNLPDAMAAEGCVVESLFFKQDNSADLLTIVSPQVTIERSGHLDIDDSESKARVYETVDSTEPPPREQACFVAHFSTVPPPLS